MAAAAERTPPRQAPPASDHMDVQHAILRELNTIAFLLTASDDVIDYQPSAVGATDTPRQMLEQRDWPIAGGRRWIVNRPGQGKSAATVGIVPLLPQNEGRMGGIIACALGPVTLYLCDRTVLDGGQFNAPQIVLVTGAMWDFKLGDVLWCGSVVAIGGAGTNVTVAEV